MPFLSTLALLSITAVFLGAVGASLTFAPAEVLAWGGGAPDRPTLVVAQACGAMALAWAVLCWMSRKQRIGGIYNRPLALANTLHFSMGALMLVRLASDGGPFERVLLAPYVALALWWIRTLYTSPV